MKVGVWVVKVAVELQLPTLGLGCPALLGVTYTPVLTSFFPHMQTSVWLPTLNKSGWYGSTFKEHLNI